MNTRNESAQGSERIVATGSSRILFLDYDGVLHPGDVYLIRREPVLRAEGNVSLFGYASILEQALADQPDIRIVLSTSWVPQLGFDRAKGYLPAAIRERVIGATWHRHAGIMRNDWLRFIRFLQIDAYVHRHQLTNWLAIDDDAVGWPVPLRHHLVHCEDPYLGLSNPSVLARLKAALS